MWPSWTAGLWRPRSIISVWTEPATGFAASGATGRMVRGKYGGLS